MAEVIQLTSQKKQPPTKTTTHEHAGQRYTVAYDPNAPPGQQWVWHVDFVRSYRYVGSANTAEKAGVEARKLIHNQIKREDT